MLPTRPDKKPAIFTSSLFPNGEQEQEANTRLPEESRKKQLLRNGLVVLVSTVLAIAFIIWGPAADFIAGRAFTISTTDRITYIFYNWTITLPLDKPSFNMQSWNNRLVGHITFAPTTAVTDRILVNIETTVPTPMFKITPWTLNETAQSGFGIVVNDLIPNKYGIDYANVIVYLPAGRPYEDLIWNSYPPATGPSALPGRKWNVSFRNLTEAGIVFDTVRVSTDSGAIHSDGLRASEGHFKTVHGPISGEYTVPPEHFTRNTSDDKLLNP